MKHRLLLTSVVALASALFAPGAFAQLLISGVFDGPLTGGTPKAVELYAVSDISDLSVYAIGTANNGGGSNGPEFTLSGSATAGQFLYVATESVQFNAFFGFLPDLTSDQVAGNGDDAFELFHNGLVIDVFGEIDVDGTGQPWEYLDGWAYRADGTGPDGSTFVLANWFFSGVNALDNAIDNSSAPFPFPVGTFVPEPSCGAGVACLATLGLLRLRRCARRSARSFPCDRHAGAKSRRSEREDCVPEPASPPATVAGLLALAAPACVRRGARSCAANAR